MTMNRRRGITLTEVLVTLFVLAIGLLALLTLFPLAALNMAQAIQDDRAALASANASAMADAFEDFRRAGGTIFSAANPGGLPDDGPSFPVYIDPVGTRAANATVKAWVGAQPSCIARKSSPWDGETDFPWGAGWNQTAYNNGYHYTWPDRDPTYRFRFFTLQDDLVFDANGRALQVGGTVQREARYSWGYLCKYPRCADPRVLDISVVVYANRSVFTAGANAGEVVCNATGVAGSNGLDVTPASGAAIRKGIWILDISTESTVAGRSQYGPCHGHFYRVVNVAKKSSGNYLFELLTPLKAPVTRIVVMENVVDVFEKGAGWRTGNR